MTTKLRFDKTSRSIYSCFPLYIHLFGLTFQRSFLVFWVFFCPFSHEHTRFEVTVVLKSLVLDTLFASRFQVPHFPRRIVVVVVCTGGLRQSQNLICWSADKIQMKNIVPATWQVGWVGCEKSTLVVGLWNFKYLGLLEASAKKRLELIEKEDASYTC